jgi:hypothetical protein
MLVQESDLDDAFGQLETADRLIMSDLGLAGIMSGLTVAEDSPTGLSVIVATGTCYDQEGARVRVPSQQVVDLSVDFNGASTAVVTATWSRWLSVYLIADRDLTDPQTDGNGATVYVSRNQSFAFKVVQGAEAFAPTRPTLLTDAILLADVVIAQGATAVVNANLDVTRRMNLITVAGAPLSLDETSILDAFTAVQDKYNLHVTGGGDQHLADQILYSGSAVFADGVTLLASSADLETTIDSFVAYLAQKASTPSGADLVGCREDASVSPTLIAGSVNDRLVALRSAANLSYAGGGAFADSTANPAATVEVAIDTIIASLTSTSGNRGAGKLTAPAEAGSPDSLTVGTVADQLGELLSHVNARARIASAETITGQYTFNQQILYSSSAITRVQRGPMVVTSIALAHSTFSLKGNLDVSGGGQTAEQEMDDLADGSTLTTATAWISPSVDGLVPSTRPTLEVKKVDLQTSTVSSIAGPTTDPNSTDVTYEIPHSFSITGMSEVIDRSRYRYYAVLTGEAGSNNSSLTWMGTTATMTVTSQSKVA